MMTNDTYDSFVDGAVSSRVWRSV